MKRKITGNLRVILLLSVFSFLLISVTWISKSSRVQSQSKGQPAPLTQSGIERINAKARAVRGPDKEAIQNLTGEIMSLYGWDDVPAPTRDSVKNRIVSAEQSFQEGNSKGISEFTLARALNGLVVKFNAPEYAKTSASEVKEVRGRLLAFLPDLIGRGRVEKGKVQARKLGSSIEEMSPVEAAYLAMTMLHQKMYNPDFQVTQEERRVRWIVRHAKTPRTLGSEKTETAPSPTARQREMESVMRSAATATSLADLLTLPDKVLDALGIAR
jgi:hypothetical protein